MEDASKSITTTITTRSESASFRRRFPSAMSTNKRPLGSSCATLRRGQAKRVNRL